MTPAQRFAVALIAVGVALLVGCLWWLLRDDRRHAQHIRDLRNQTPDHDQQGGPTRYDKHGRVTGW
jgi:hypothetical protein